MVFDPFHVCALVSTAVDEVRRVEAKEGSAGVRESLKDSVYQFRKNPENLTPGQTEELSNLDLKHLATGVAYLVRLELRDMYQSARTHERARYRLENWLNWAQAKCDRWGAALAPLAKAVSTIRKNLTGVLNHWLGNLSTAFVEGLNSVFSAVKRKARGYRGSEYMTCMLHFVAGKLLLPKYSSH
jgi:transposase